MKNIFKSTMTIITISLILTFAKVHIEAETIIDFNHSFTDEASLLGDTYVKAFQYYDSFSSEDDVLLPLDTTNIENGNLWMHDPKYGYTYYYYEINYIDDTIVRGRGNLKVDDIKNIDDVTNVAYFYTDTAKIIVNRYLDEVTEDKLINSEEFSGRSEINYTDEYPLFLEGDELLIEPNLSGYNFVQSNFDTSQAVKFKYTPKDLDNENVINLVYSKEQVGGSITINYLDESKNILETYTLNGMIGDTLAIDESLFTQKSNYTLVSFPTISEAIFNESEQVFDFVYKEKTTNTVIDEEKEVDSENNNEKDNVNKPINKDNKVDTPNTGISINYAYYTLTIGILALGFLLLKNRKKA